MIQKDGRHLMSHKEKKQRVWEKLKGWRLDPTDPNYLIPNFDPCPHRKLLSKCLPCGSNGPLGYWCELKQTWVSVSYCKACNENPEKNNNTIHLLTI